VEEERLGNDIPVYGLRCRHPNLRIDRRRGKGRWSRQKPGKIHVGFAAKGVEHRDSDPHGARVKGNFGASTAREIKETTDDYRATLRGTRLGVHFGVR
jgi:hypothetical protein